jgi:hypothetical protein
LQSSPGLTAARALTGGVFVYLYLSPEKDFVAFCCIYMKTHKRIDTIDSIDCPVFSMLW